MVERDRAGREYLAVSPRGTPTGENPRCISAEPLFEEDSLGSTRSDASNASAGAGRRGCASEGRGRGTPSSEEPGLSKALNRFQRHGSHFPVIRIDLVFLKSIPVTIIDFCKVIVHVGPSEEQGI